MGRAQDALVDNGVSMTSPSHCNVGLGKRDPPGERLRSRGHPESFTAARHDAHAVTKYLYARQAGALAREGLSSSTCKLLYIRRNMDVKILSKRIEQATDEELFDDAAFDAYTNSDSFRTVRAHWAHQQVLLKQELSRLPLVMDVISLVALYTVDGQWDWSMAFFDKAYELLRLWQAQTTDTELSRDCYRMLRKLHTPMVIHVLVDDVEFFRRTENFDFWADADLSIERTIAQSYAPIVKSDRLVQYFDATRSHNYRRNSTLCSR